ncbi:transmembrane protein [Anaeramoeba flamelloides]|uniref:Transmembrane protein n=1 Tax=Anaeramoeba flamelloides TaxID=1746091 RepID=A0AAV8A8L9_9EUKA|nr:transmembrane protein [Anaeramoeba flamelloides]KAJ6230622.1 transmembrane protein [Anaeramoeba flamelloides]
MDVVQMRLKIDEWTKKNFIIFSVVFLVVFILSITIGQFGPSVHEFRENKRTMSNHSHTFDLEIVDLNRLNQMLFVDLHFKNDMEFEIEADVQIEINWFGSTEESNPQSWNEISKSTHNRTVSCEAKSNCTKHTIIYEEYLHYKHYLGKLSILNLEETNFFETLFVDDQFQRSKKLFWIPKTIPLVIMYITFFIIYFLTQTHEVDDPQYETHNDQPGFFTVQVIMFLCFGIYVFWLIYSTIRSFVECKNEKAKYKRLKFFVLISSFVVICSIIALIGRYIEKFKDKAVEFLVFYSIYNSYIICYSYAILPTKEQVEDYRDSNIQNLNDELEDSSDYDSNKSQKNDVELKNQSQSSSEKNENSSSEKNENSSSEKQSQSSSHSD